VPRLDGGPSRPASLRDFYLEAQITATFDHENILSCLGISAGKSAIHTFRPFSPGGCHGVTNGLSFQCGSPRPRPSRPPPTSR